LGNQSADLIGLIEGLFISLQRLLVLESNIVLIKIIYNLLSFLIRAAFVTSKPEDHVDCAFLCNVVIGETAIVLKLLACKDKSLLIGWNSLLVLDLLLHLVDRASKLQIKSDSFSS